MEQEPSQLGRRWHDMGGDASDPVLPDEHDFERDFEDLQAYLKSHTGKEYPVELTGATTSASGGADRPVALTDEELIGEW